MLSPQPATSARCRFPVFRPAATVDLDRICRETLLTNPLLSPAASLLAVRGGSMQYSCFAADDSLRRLFNVFVQRLGAGLPLQLTSFTYLRALRVLFPRIFYCCEYAPQRVLPIMRVSSHCL